jgi:hypothetical protein
MKTVVVLGIVIALVVLEAVAVMVVVVVITRPLRSNLELFKAMSEGVLFVLPTATMNNRRIFTSIYQLGSVSDKV